DVDDEDITAVCGNREVEPGEDCDPPSVETACFTTCGSAGTGECTAECQAPAAEDCTPPAETCNLVDDDCDGLVDEGVIAAWSDAVTLAAGRGASAPSMRLAWTGTAYAAAWVVSGTPDTIHVAAVDQLGEVVTTETALALTAGDVNGRPALTWTGSNLMLAWSTTSSERHVAVVDLSASVVAHNTTIGTNLGPSPDLSWSGSHAAIAWTMQVDSFMEMHVETLVEDGTHSGWGWRVTSGATTSQPAVDADGSAIALAWVDARSGDPEVHRAVYGHDGSPIAMEAALTSTGGVSSPAISAMHRIAAWTDDRDGTDRVYTIALDGSWNPIGTDAAVADGAAFTFEAVTDRIGLIAGADLLTLGVDGLAAGAAMALGLDAAAALAWGDLAAGAAGASGPDLVLALAGCAEHETCDAWTSVLTPLETRTGHDLLPGHLGHDAAVEGSFTSRPVTYLSIQMFQDAPFHGPEETGIYTLTGMGYETCGLCVLVYEDCTTSTCGATYLARSGVLEIASIGESGDRLAGVLRNARLDEVTINSTTRESDWVEDGGQICIGSYSFDETID
ncbi:MAG: hypothetical protein JRG91_19780, partial [Deltaproteobacteria bacterium]|nr:hypothetical protein [Deltaproteobacteria bacterium]